MRSPVKSLVAAALAAAFSAPALAEDIDFFGFANGSEDVTYTLDYADNSLDRSATVSAGGFNTSVNGGATFVSYCIDLYNTITLPASYTGYSAVSSTLYTFTNPGAASAISRFLTEGNPVTNSVQQAAFQIALWELTYETSGTYDLLSGTASFSGGNGAIDIASGWLSVLSGDTTPFTVYQSPVYQDVITSPIPEPSTYALMVAGLAGLGYVARRRRDRKTA